MVGLSTEEDKKDEKEKASSKLKKAGTAERKNEEVRLSILVHRNKRSAGGKRTESYTV
jgi:hypothetical protein